MSFCLNGTDLPVQNPLLTLDVCMGFFFQSFPLSVNFHDLIFLCIFLSIIFIETFCFMFTATTICASIHLKCLCITSLFFFLSPDMMKLPSIMTDVIKFILKYLRFHVVILSNIFCVRTCFPFFMILQFDITGDFMVL